MAVVNQILHRKNTSGEYDTIYLKANLANVTGVLAPEHGGTGDSEFTPYVHPTEKQCNYSYTHPTSKQCDAAAGSHTHSDATTSAAGFMSSSDKTKLNGLSNYTHPSAKQCNYSVDLGNYYTKAEVDAKLERIKWSLGSTVQWDNKQWLVCHIDYSKGYYLISNNIISNTKFNNSNSNTQYAGSNLAQTAMNYQTNQMSAAALAQCVNVTVNGVTAKVFVPSYEQMNGDFDWFNNNTNRIASYQGSATAYWTSSKDYSGSYLYAIGADGKISGGNSAGASQGFRPCICVKI